MGTNPGSDPNKPSSNPSNTPPPLPVAKSGGQIGRFMPLGIIGAIVILVLVGSGVLVARLVQAPGSTRNDEVNSAKKQASDYATWTASLKRIEGSGELPNSAKVAPEDEEGKKVSAWDKWFILPNETAVRAALLRRLPKEIKLVSLVPQSYEKNEDELSVNYLVTVRLKAPLYLVPISRIKFTQPDLMKYQRLTQYVLASTDLAPGLTYDDAAAKQVSEGRKNLTFFWKINRAAIEDGKWQVLDADPIFLQQIPALEERLVNASGGRALVLRTQAELDTMATARDEALTAFATRLKSIDDQVGKFRSERMAGVPGKVSRSSAKFGGSGSGEPTKSAARIGGGAASGAAIGALATGGDGEAAGIGAGAGFVAGLIYDAVSKSNDKKKFEAAKERDYQERLAARNAALRGAEREVAQYEQQLLNEYEKELATAAQQRLADLKARQG